MKSPLSARSLSYRSTAPSKTLAPSALLLLVTRRNKRRKKNGKFHLPILCRTILCWIVANTLSSWRKDHARWAAQIGVAAVVTSTTNHRLPQIFGRGSRELRAYSLRATLNGRNAVLVENHSGTVDEKLPVHFAALFGLLRDGLERVFALCDHLRKYIIPDVPQIETKCCSMRHSVYCSGLRMEDACRGQAIMGFGYRISSDNHFGSHEHGIFARIEWCGSSMAISSANCNIEPFKSLNA